MKFTRSSFLSYFVYLTVFAATTSCLAQNIVPYAPPVQGAGYDTEGFAAGFFQETVDPQSGSLSVHFALPVPPTRGHGLPISFMYSSEGVNIFSKARWGTGLVGPWTGAGGWSYTFPTLTAFADDISSSISYGPDSPPMPLDCSFLSSFVFYDTNGGGHNFPSMSIYSSPSQGCQNISLPYYPSAGDDQFIAISLAEPASNYSALPQPVTVYGFDGTTYLFSNPTPVPSLPGAVDLPNGSEGIPYFWSGTSIEDRNGNLATFAAGNGQLSYTDSTSRAAISVTGVGTSQHQIHVSGLDSNFISSWTTTPITFTNTGSTILNTGPDSYCPGQMRQSSQNSVQVASSLQLPDGGNYTFTYDPSYGLLNKITNPNGAFIRYTWGISPDAAYSYFQDPVSGALCGFTYGVPRVIKREISYDGTNVAEEQDYAYQTSWGEIRGWYGVSNATTAVTTHDLVRQSASKATVYKYDYTQGVPLPSGGAVGPSAPANIYPAGPPYLSSVVDKDANGNILHTANKLWFDSSLLGCEVDTLGTGISSGKWYTYNGGKQVTDTKTYDYGLVTPQQCSSGTVPSVTPMQETQIIYQDFPALNDIDRLTEGIPNQPAQFFPGGLILDAPSDIKKFGNGALASETLYQYD